MRNSDIKSTMRQRIKSNFTWTVIGEAIGKGIFFFTNIYLARKLQVDNFGLFVLAQTVTSYCWLSVDLGINMYGIREIAKNKENRIETINTLLTIRIVSGAFIFILYVLSLQFIFTIPQLTKYVFIGSGLYLLTYSLYTDWIFKGIEQFKYVAFGKLLSSLVYVFGILNLIQNSENVFKATLVYSLSFLAGAIFLFIILYVKIGIVYTPIVNIKLWWKHLKGSLFFTLAGVLNISSRSLPVLLLGIFWSNYEIGLYSASNRIISSICGFGELIPISFYPILSNVYVRNRNHFFEIQTQLFYIMSSLGIICCVLGFAFGSELIPLLFGTDYNDSIIVFKILTFSILFSLMRPSFGYPILSMGLHKLRSASAFMSLVICLLLGLLLISKYGITGMAITVTVTELANLTFLAIVYYRCRRVA